MDTTTLRGHRLTRLATLLTGIVVGIGAVVLAAQGGSQPAQPSIGARVKPVLTIEACSSRTPTATAASTRTRTGGWTPMPAPPTSCRR